MPGAFGPSWCTTPEGDHGGRKWRVLGRALIHHRGYGVDIGDGRSSSERRGKRGGKIWSSLADGADVKLTSLSRSSVFRSRVRGWFVTKVGRRDMIGLLWPTLLVVGASCVFALYNPERWAPRRLESTPG